MAEERRTYTAEFKLAAVKLVTERGYSVAEAARSLGVTEKILRKWRRALQDQGEQAFPGKGNLPADQEEVRRLKEDVQPLRMACDIRKTATGFFAKESL